MVIGLSIITTGGSFTTYTAGEVSLNALDVCHSSPVATTSDLPYISSEFGLVIPLEKAFTAAAFDLDDKTSILCFDVERPPASLS